MANVPSIKLSSGADMPQVGFGLWKVGTDIAADTVYNAIKAGYRLFDGACDYGNETECGQGVARAIADGLVKREELFIVSKLWNTFHDGERVEPIVKKQLADWGVDYFDLYLIHFPVALDQIKNSKASIQETWTAMEGLVEKGLAKSIGVSNFQGQLLYDLLRYAKIRPATLQIEHHPYLVQQELLNLAKAEGILLRWATQRGLAIIPKTTRPALMTANLESTNFDLASEDLEAISGLDRNLRFNQPSNYFSTDALWIFG
ncbi:unnamed protein product [Parascedosporium putredinis]|uniref:NADP-dependent oxidoreductase domain-containing protein n=1 Tax=Parascedosporium putredinis TaxID=1442378 RepID=A0A9P1HC00_9PEZI|nr:unnamed protein product [Parascedosporium putredinis]CAI8003276.1 unnamed protein product [Parascedosporium putredinis]